MKYIRHTKIIKHIKNIEKTNLMVVILILGIGFSLAVSLRFSDTIQTYFPNIQTQKASVHFDTAGNDFGGSIYREGLKAVSNEGIAVSGGNILCEKQIKGIYFNNQRGKRLWPLDHASLIKLQSIDSSYNNLTISGGLYTNCSTGRQISSIAGQVTHNRRGKIFKLIAGVQMNANNTYTNTYTNSLQYSGSILSGKVFDSYGGVASIFGTGLLDTQNIIVSISEIGSGVVRFSGGIIGLPPGTNIYLSGATEEVNAGIINLYNGTMNLSSGVYIGGKMIVPTKYVLIDASTGVIVYVADNRENYVYLPDRTTIMASTGWDQTIELINISGGDIIFGSNVPLLFDEAVKIYFNGLVASSTNFPRYKYSGETAWHDITTVCDTSFAISPTNISLTGTNTECYQTNGTDTIIWTYHATTFIVPTAVSIITGTTIQGGAGGGSRLTKDNCELNTSHAITGANEENIDYSPSYYDATCKGPVSIIKHEPALISCSTYSNELNSAYGFARSYDITTIDQCTKANIYGKLIRKDMAKMMVNFVLNVLNRTGMQVDNPSCIEFNDISHESDTTKLYIQLACEMGLMGMSPDGVTVAEAFNPNDEVTRAQYGTILSRLLRGLDNAAEDGELYYTHHLAALKNAHIMTKIADPSMKELRGRVMVMLKRIYDLGN